MKFKLGCTPAALARTLEHLVEMGLVRRATGTGHPMRPEYLLTDQGVDLAVGLLPFAEWVALRGCDYEAYLKWSPAVLVACNARNRRFAELRRMIGAPTDRALSRCLQVLADAGLVVRRVLDSRPPIALYRTAEDEPLAEALELLSSAAKRFGATTMVERP